MIWEKVNDLDVSSEETGKEIWRISSAQCQEKALEVGYGHMHGCEESRGDWSTGGDVILKTSLPELLVILITAGHRGAEIPSWGFSLMLLWDCQFSVAQWDVRWAIYT